LEIDRVVGVSILDAPFPSRAMKTHPYPPTTRYFPPVIIVAPFGNMKMSAAIEKPRGKVVKLRGRNERG